MNQSLLYRNIGRFATITALGGIISRLLGLARDRLLATYLGAGSSSDIYLAAFRIPDFMYGLLILGSISAVFIPLFNSIHDPKEQNNFVRATITIIGIGVTVISLILIIFAPLFIDIIAPGFTPEAKAMTILLTRIMLIQPILLALGNIITNVLQSFHKFFLAAIAPSMYNVGIIIGILLSVPNPLIGSHPPLGLQGLAYGVVFGSFLSLLVQLPALAGSGFSWQPLFVLTPGIKKMFTLMGPRVLGVAADQVNLIVITAIASTLTAGSITIFTWAQNIQSAPMAIIGISIATVVFPSLSRLFALNEKEEFTDTFAHAFKLILFFSLPLSLLFILLRAQIIRVVLGAGLFGWEQTRLAAASLGIFSASLFAQSLTPLLTRAYYSMHDTKTPVLIGLFAFVINIVFSLIFINLLSYPNSLLSWTVSVLKLQNLPDIRVIGLAMAFSITVVIEFLLLLIVLFMRIDGNHLVRLNSSWITMVGASFLMSLVTYASLRPLAHLVGTSTTLGVFAQGAGAGLVGIIVYLVVTYLLKENPIINNNRTPNKFQ